MNCDFIMELKINIFWEADDTHIPKNFKQSPLKIEKYFSTAFQQKCFFTIFQKCHGFIDGYDIHMVFINGYLFWKLNWILFNFRIYIYRFWSKLKCLRVVSLDFKIGTKHGSVLSVIKSHQNFLIKSYHYSHQ